MEYAQILTAIVDRVSSLPQREFKTRRVISDLARFSDLEIAHVLDLLYRRALNKDRDCLDLLEALSDFTEVKRQLGRRLSGIFEIADRKKLMLAAEWLAPIPIKAKRQAKLYAHQDLQDVTLGERKWMARKADPLLIEKLLVDPDPAVIHNLLRHPRLLERDVIKICARRPNHPDVLREVFNNPRWFTRYEVKKALVNNPDTPPRLVMAILPSISIQDIKLLRRSRRFSPGFINHLLSVLQQSTIPKRNVTPKKKTAAKQVEQPSEPVNEKRKRTATDSSETDPINAGRVNTTDDDSQLH